MSQTCPSCSRPASGQFCRDCGASLVPAECGECGAPITAGSRFCSDCGAPAAGEAVRDEAPAVAGADGPASKLPWIVSAVAVAAVLALLLVPRLRDTPPGSASGVMPAAGAPMPSVADLTSMSPRDAADRLFNRVMTAVSEGDEAQAQMFLPMALSAYQQVPELDLDGRYHLGLLQLVAQRPDAARAQADTILMAEPNHLFGLITAAQAEEEMGSPATARSFYQRFLNSYDAESARDLPEYRDHQQILPVHLEAAQRRVSGS